jgi:ABC-type uncharacterized transport system substrate-binding protein
MPDPDPPDGVLAAAGLAAAVRPEGVPSAARAFFPAPAGLVAARVAALSAALAAAIMALFWAALPAPARADAGGPGRDRPWRVIYVEAGPYRDYVMNLSGLAQGLQELGLIGDGGAPPPSGDDARATWMWLSRNAGGDRLIFEADGFYSAGWDHGLLEPMGAEVLGRLRSGGADLVLAMGTAASLVVATDGHSVPTLSITATDPVAAGISETAERSGLDHVHVQVEAGRIERQLSMFHHLIGFRTLGVPYDATERGRAAMGVGAIERVARERGFEVVPCLAELELPSLEASSANLVGCLERLSQGSEAVYLTVSNGMMESRMDAILAPLTARRIPTFSQKGPSETRLGVLMSLAEDDFLASGRFEAEVVARILSGEAPGGVGQIYVPPLTMALNFSQALAIGWDPPFEVLVAVDELYVDEAGPR